MSKDDVVDNVADDEALDLSKADRGDELVFPEDEPAEPAEGAEAEGAEGEGEGEDEGSEDGGEQARDEKGRFASGPKIPKARFDEAVGKEREAREAAERKAAELERQLNERTKTEETSTKLEELEGKVSELERQHADMLLDGDSEGAAKIMREIRHAERQIARAEIANETQNHVSRTLEAERVEAAVARLEADTPQFNPQSEEYDQDLVDLVLSKQRSLIEREGLSPSRALERAGEDVRSRFLSQKSEEGEQAGLGKAGTAEDRRAAQVKKNLDTQKRQAPSMKDSGMDSDKAGVQGKVEVAKLTDEEFAALPESTKAKLRGDML